jgi:hypothetical protein
MTFVVVHGAESMSQAGSVKLEGWQSNGEGLPIPTINREPTGILRPMLLLGSRKTSRAVTTSPKSDTCGGFPPGTLRARPPLNAKRDRMRTSLIAYKSPHLGTVMETRPM